MVNWVAAVIAVISLWLCFAATNKVGEILEHLDIHGDGVGFVWLFFVSPAIMTLVYMFVDSL